MIINETAGQHDQQQRVDNGRRAGAADSHRHVTLDSPGDDY